MFQCFFKYIIMLLYICSYYTQFTLFPSEQFIQNVVNQLGRHSITMDAFMGKDLDHLAGVITGALKEVDEKRPVAGAQPGPEASDPSEVLKGNMLPSAKIELYQDQDPKTDHHQVQDLNHKDTLRLKQQGRC